MPAADKTAKRAPAARTGAPAFTDDERAAMAARSKEVKAAKSKGTEDDEAGLLAKIAEMPPPDRALAERVHSIVRASAPELTCRTWYGMPAYAKNGKVVCWFKAADKFKARYATLGFSDQAALDKGAMWPTEYALTKPTKADEAAIAKLIKRAVR
jgi:uncharacterized protein YdhG (YjbR/CyaY superfamily)